MKTLEKSERLAKAYEEILEMATKHKGKMEEYEARINELKEELSDIEYEIVGTADQKTADALLKKRKVAREEMDRLLEYYDMDIVEAIKRKLDKLTNDGTVQAAHNEFKAFKIEVDDKIKKVKEDAEKQARDLQALFNDTPFRTAEVLRTKIDSIVQRLKKVV